MSEKEIKRFVMHYQRLTEVMLQTLAQQADIVLAINNEHNYQLVLIYIG